MFIEYKLSGRDELYLNSDIEAQFPLTQVSNQSRQLYEEYQAEVGQRSLFLQFIRDAFANDIFSDHYETYQKLVHYSLAIDALQELEGNVEFVNVYEAAPFYADFLSSRHRIKVFTRIPLLDSGLTKRPNRQGTKKQLRASFNFKRLVNRLYRQGLKRCDLVHSLMSLRAGNNVALHHSARFNDILMLSEEDIGPVEKISYFSDAKVHYSFYVRVLTLIVSVLSFCTSIFPTVFTRFFGIPKIATCFFGSNSRNYIARFRRFDGALFFYFSFNFFYKFKKINRAFVYSHLDLLSRCFIRFTKSRRKPVDYIRFNFLYFTTELQSLDCARFLVRSVHEACVARTLGFLDVHVLNNIKHQPHHSHIERFSVVYIDESSAVDNEFPGLRSGIYEDLARLSKALDVEVCVRRHPTERAKQICFPDPLKVDTESDQYVTVEDAAVIVGRSSTFLLKLAHLGKAVVVYDPVKSSWYVNQCKLVPPGELCFVDDYLQLELEIKSHAEKFS